MANYKKMRRGRFNNFVRKDSAIVLPPKSALVWPGIGFAQHISDTLPAWSMHLRNRREKFAEWIFSEVKITH